MKLFKDKNSKKDRTLEGYNWILAVIYFSFVSIFIWLGIYNKNYLFLIASGALLGFYYGYLNYRIFHYPHTDGFYKDYLPTRKDKKQGYFDVVPAENNAAKINSIWVHIVCAIVGSLALHFLNLKFNSLLEEITNERTVLNSILFLIALGGYTGLLPRWI